MRTVCLCLFLSIPVISQQEPPAGHESSAALYLEGRSLFERQRYAEALKVIQRSLDIAPNDPELHKLAALCAIRMDRLDIAEPELKTAAQLAPNDYLIHFHLGALYYTKSLFGAAKGELDSATRLNPSHMPSLLFLGLALEEIGDEKTTSGIYRKAIELASHERSAREVPYTYLGRFYYRLNRFAESLPLLEKAVEINPGSAEALLPLGKVLHALERSSEAIPVLERCVAADAANPEPHYLLFRIYESAGREQEAQAELKRFQQLKPKPASDPRRRSVQAAAER